MALYVDRSGARSSALREDEGGRPQPRRGARALALAAEIIPLVAGGLTAHSAQQVCEALRERAKVDAVALTGGDGVILAACGEGMEHHVAGAPYRTKLIGRVLSSAVPATARTTRAIGCVVPTCPLTAGVAAPIVVDGRVLGALSAWRTERRPLGRRTIELVVGLADVIAAQLRATAATGV